MPQDKIEISYSEDIIRRASINTGVSKEAVEKVYEAIVKAFHTTMQVPDTGAVRLKHLGLIYAKPAKLLYKGRCFDATQAVHGYSERVEKVTKAYRAKAEILQKELDKYQGYKPQLKTERFWSPWYTKKMSLVEMENFQNNG